MGFFDDLGKPPIEVSADKKMVAADMYENFTAFVQAGFTREEALQLVLGMAAAIIHQQRHEDNE